MIITPDKNHVAFKEGVLVPDKHTHFIKNMSRFAETAGICEEDVYLSTKGKISDRELEWLEDYPKHRANKTYGLVYNGEFKDDILLRMNAITGFFVRNFKDARVMTINEVVDGVKDNDPPLCTVLSIPNFFTVGNSVGVKMFDGDISGMIGLLFKRANKGLLTLLYVEDFTQFQKAFGNSFANFLENYKFVRPEHKI